MSRGCAAEPSPAARVNVYVIPAYPASANRSRRRVGRSNADSARPAAITAAESTSIRPRAFALSSPGLPFASRRSVDFEIAVASARFSASATGVDEQAAGTPARRARHPYRRRRGGSQSASAPPRGPGNRGPRNPCTSPPPQPAPGNREDRSAGPPGTRPAARSGRDRSGAPRAFPSRRRALNRAPGARSGPARLRTPSRFRGAPLRQTAQLRGIEIFPQRDR